MAITPGPGYMVDPNNPNSVIPIGSSAQAQNLGTYNTSTAPSANISYGATNPTPSSSGVITRTSTAAPAPTPSYTGVVNNSINNTPAGDALVSSNQAQAAALGITIPGVGGGSATTPTQPITPATAAPANIGTTGSSTGNNTFTGLINQEASTSAAGSPTAAAAGEGALSTAQNQSAYDEALANYNSAVQAVSDFQSRQASQFSNLEASGEPLALVTGRETALQAGYAAQLDALQQKVTSASNALNAGVSEQNAQTSAYGTAGSIGNTAQSTAQSGLGTAISAAAPTSSFPFSYNPETGQFTDASTGASVSTGFSGNYSQDTSTMAQAVMSGKIGYSDAESALQNYYGSTADSNLTSAIESAGGNPTVLKAQATALSQNTTAVGTAPVTAQLGVYNQQVAQLGASQVAAQQIGAFGDQLIATMSAAPAQGGLGINPYSSQYANSTLNSIKSQFNDPQYATFNTNIAGLQARVSALLSTGEIPTAATAGAQAIVNGNATLQAMQATLQQIQAEAGAITGAQANVASTALQGAQSAAGVTSSTANPWH